MPILNAATYYYYLYVCVCVCVCVVQPCQNWNPQLLRGTPATHVSPEGEQTRHHIGGRKKRRKERRNGRRPANEGQRGSGESVKAPIVLLCSSSKDGPAATATLGLPLNFRTYRVHGCFCASEERGGGS